MTPLHVWLAYVAYPITTAVYFERALRLRCQTTTIGPPLPHELIEKWQLQNMKLPLGEQDISTDFTPDMAEIISGIDPEQLPDLYLWIESVGGYFPQNLEAVSCPKICYLIDSHHNLLQHLEWANRFDFVFIAQKEYLDEFRKLGMNAHWLPLGCDSDVHCSIDIPKIFPIGFEGSVSGGSRREALLTELATQIPVQYDRCFWEDRARLFSESKIIFNSAAKNDLNMRNFEVMSSGTLVLTDMAKNSGQDVLFVDGEDYAVYRDNNIIDVARFYLGNEGLRERIAARSQRLVHNAHTIGHRVDDMLAVTLDGKTDTFSAEELRERSLVGVPSFYEEIRTCVNASAPARSFVIPVLDYSPASEYNILTLLDDLEKIEGEVVVVFNGSQVGDELKNHPRITRHAIMRQNIGVARGWNVGLDMAESETVFILNADVHISSEAVTTVEKGLKNLPLAACVGPQGAFVDYYLCRDHCYLDKGSFGQPHEVDAVSGFLFAVNRRLFTENGLQFENDFTPCYFEEWDIGLQIKMAGLKNYVVPTTAYDHHWSGTIRALHTIPYLGRDESAVDIQLRNRQLFVSKWRHIARHSGNPDLLESRWKFFLLECGNVALLSGNMPSILEISETLAKHFPEDATVRAFTRMSKLQSMKHCATNYKPQ
jgi:GT2 family glycosyltransferase